MRTRTLVLLRKDVAPSKWYDKFSALVAEAEGKTDGVQATTQGSDKQGNWNLGIGIEKGWAAFYGDDNDKTWLHVQNY
jgi:hypothetical protein